MLQPLESRRLLSSSLSAGTLTVLGTAAADTITLSLVGGTTIRVTESVGSLVSNFALASVSKIVVKTGAGNDSLTISTNIARPASILGESGNDTLHAGNGNDTMDGGPGNDKLYGWGGDDSINGGSENDSVYGGSGNDTLDGGTGADSLDGSNGTDTVTYASRISAIDAYIELVPGSGTAFTKAGRCVSDGDVFSGVEKLTGGSGNDRLRIVATNPSDLIDSAVGAYEIVGGAGNDTMRVDGQWYDHFDDAVTLRGGSGDDRFEIDELRLLQGKYFGDDGADAFFHQGERLATGVDGGAGFDREDVSPTGGTLNMSANVERIDVHGSIWASTYGNGLDNTIVLHDGGFADGGAGNDWIEFRDSATVVGSAGNDTLYGGTMSESRMLGGPGDDTYLIQPFEFNGDFDEVAELPGEGYDTLDFTRLAVGMTVNLVSGSKSIATSADGKIKLSVQTMGQAANFEVIRGTPAADKLTGNAAGNLVVGYGGNDTLDGQSGNDSVYGGSGNDTVYGGSGNDKLYGESDNDKLYGGSGNDSIWGAAGADSLYGESGDDRLDGGLQFDYLDGGSGGGDVVDYSARTTTIVAKLIVDEGGVPNTATGFRLRGEGGQAGEVDTYAWCEQLWGGSNPDQLRIEGRGGNFDTPTYEFALRGNGGGDYLVASADFYFDGGASRTSLVGSDGNDSLACNTSSGESGTFAPHAFGDAGNDLFYGINPEQNFGSVNDSGGTDRVEFTGTLGTSYYTMPSMIEDATIRGGDVQLTANARNNRITLLNSNATVYAGAGNDTVIGSAGNDRIYGSSGNDSLEGGAGKDTIYGESGNDVLSGQAQADRLDGGDGDDSLYGGTGNDVLTGGLGKDRFFGQDGDDTLYADDGIAEYVDGGAGFDRARRDAIDTVLNVEGSI